MGWLSDRWGDRTLPMIFAIIPTIVAFAMMIGLDPSGIPKSKGALLFALYMSNTFTAVSTMPPRTGIYKLMGHCSVIHAASDLQRFEPGGPY